MKKGFTILEALMAISILAVVAVVIVSSLSDLRERSEIKSGTQIVETVLQEARQKTLSSEGLTTYGVHVEESSVTMFPGAVYIADDSQNTVYEVGETIELTTSLNAGSQSILFERLTGETDDYGSITLTSSSGAVATINISKTGLIYE